MLMSEKMQAFLFLRVTCVHSSDTSQYWKTPLLKKHDAFICTHV